MSKLPLPDLGAYLREQRENAQLSLRQLADVAGVSNPYLSQIERGLKRPSAEILQQIAKGLQVSAESLYVRAGILDERVGDDPAPAPAVLTAIAADPALTDRQRGVLVDVYLSFVGDGAADTAPEPTLETPAATAEPRSAVAPRTPRSTRTTSSANPRKPASSRRSLPSPAPEAQASAVVTEKEK